MAITGKNSSNEVHKTEKETGNSLHRQWQILSRLPNGKWIGTRDLQEQLQREGIDISLRTIQRDLNQIAERFPIENNGATPQGWRWKTDAPIQSIPHMNSSQAVTFMMVEEHLKHLLPPSLLAEINPWFDLARRSLSSHQNNVRQWINRVRIIPATQPLIPPAVDRKAQTAIYEALLQDRQLECIYVKRNSQKEEKTYVLNPLALVQRGAIIYLVCTRQDKSEVQTFALHRFKSATVLDTRALTFMESKLSKDQQITDLEDDMKCISATVPFNLQLVWWLRGFGQKITHIEPQEVADLVWEK